MVAGDSRELPQSCVVSGVAGGHGGTARRVGLRIWVAWGAVVADPSLGWMVVMALLVSSFWILEAPWEAESRAQGWEEATLRLPY